MAVHWPETNAVSDLTKVAWQAVKMMPPLYWQSIFGPLGGLVPPYRRYSEFNIIDMWRLRTTVRYLLDVTLPALPQSTPALARTLFPKIVNRRFWRSTKYLLQPDAFAGVASFPGEHWFYINGVATNEDVAEFNAAYLAHLFHRPVTLIQNATDSLAVDLYECAIGKGLNRHYFRAEPESMTEPAWRATAAILAALNAPSTRRVVVIAHSQGTIIMANVLHAIVETLKRKEVGKPRAKWHSFTNDLMGEVDTDTQKAVRDNLAHSISVFTRGGHEGAWDKMRKLEIYTFANCADKMCYVYRRERVPYMEHFANEMDIVARLGVLSPLRGNGQNVIDIDGPVFEGKGTWGHLLNEHYLTAIDDHLYPVEGKPRHDRDPYPYRGRGRKRPRLYRYFHGKIPRKLAA